MQTKEELQREYTKLCLDLGNLTYQNEVMARQVESNEQEAEKIQRKMRDLSKKADQLVQLPVESTLQQTEEVADVSVNA